MDRQYTRLDAARKLVDDLIKAIPDEEEKRCAYVHLYGVGLMASLLALKRGFSRETAELAGIAGMLHDLLAYVDSAADGAEHAHPCADFAKAQVLDRLDCLTDGEKAMIYAGIYNHSDKGAAGSDFDELVKDADCAQHALRNPMEDFFFDHPRVRRVVEELTGNEQKG